MLIAIEGVDGSGKTAAAEALKQKLGFQILTKPLKDLFFEGDEKQYTKAKRSINSLDSRVIQAWFYGLSNAYIAEQADHENIIADRYIFSNISWIYDETTKPILDCMVSSLPLADFTFLLVAKTDKVKERLGNRKGVRDESWKAQYSEKVSNTMEMLVKKSGAPYLKIDTTDLSVDKTTEIMVKELTRLGLIK